MLDPEKGPITPPRGGAGRGAAGLRQVGQSLLQRASGAAAFGMSSRSNHKHHHHPGSHMPSSMSSSSFSSAWGFAQAVMHFRHKRHEEKKRTLKEVLQSKTLQRVILVLVILDLVIVAVSVQFPYLMLASTLNAVADRALLGIFVLEAIGLLYVLSPREYFRNPWHIIDGIFIAVSMILEIHEVWVHEDDLHPASPFVGASVRVWRILRIVHAFTVALELEYQEVQNSAHLEQKLRATLQKVSALEQELYHEKHARAALERELARLNRIKRSYDALGVRVPL